MEEFKKEYLGSGITALVSKEHTFGTDAVLLADFAKAKKSDKCCDLGTGCGIIPLLWCKGETGRIYAVEISEKAVNQLTQAAELNSLGDRIEIIHSDLNELKGKIEYGSFNLVTMNPPYTANGAGIMSSAGADRIARHETLCTFDDICLCASKLLNFSGRLCVCIRPERMCEMFSVMQKYGIEPKRIKFVTKRHGLSPWLVLIEGRRGGKSGLTAEPELQVYDETGGYSPEMKEIYKDYLLEQR
jgi:tRNA1(Val) A37 N6-methylase TrmN6